MSTFEIQIDARLEFTPQTTPFINNCRIWARKLRKVLQTGAVSLKIKALPGGQNIPSSSFFWSGRQIAEIKSDLYGSGCLIDSSPESKEIDWPNPVSEEEIWNKAFLPGLRNAFRGEQARLKSMEKEIETIDWNRVKSDKD